MKDKPLDPRRLDVRRFAAAAGRLQGTMIAGDLPRLVADAPLVPGQPVQWALTGEERVRRGVGPEPWLRVQATAAVELPCQRCLQPMAVHVDVDRTIQFVADEAEAERLDEHSEDDVLALPGGSGLDVFALVEDELILGLPLVPRHDACPRPLIAAGLADGPAAPAGTAGADGGGGGDAQRPHPFAALAALRRDRDADPEPGADRGDGPTGRRHDD